jgi:hypothetical protein
MIGYVFGVMAVDHGPDYRAANYWVPVLGSQAAALLPPHRQILDLSGAVAAATAPRASSSGLEAGDQLFRYGSNFGRVGGLSAIAAYNSAERAAVQLDNVDTPHVAPEFVLIGKQPLHDFMKHQVNPLARPDQKTHRRSRRGSP